MIKYIGIVFLALMGAMWASAEQPNILFFIADDMTYTDVGFMGHPDVKTPNLDRLASQGILLTHTFTAAPMCSPTRHMIYTGQFPVRNGGYPNHAKARDGVKSVVHYLGDLGYRVGLAGKSHVSPEEVFPFESAGRGSLHFDRIQNFIEQDDEEPFCLIVASKQPHTPWDQGDASQYDAATLTLPSYFADTPETREAVRNYYAEITYMDWQVGETLRILEESGQADNTLVIFCSEQGSSAPYAKWTLYDAGMRGAMIARWPGKVKAGTTSDALIQYSDLLPTWIEAAGGEPVEAIEGRSFVSLLTGKSDTHQEYVYALQTTVGINFAQNAYPIRTIRDDRYKLVWNINFTEPFTNNVTEADSVGYFESWKMRAREDSRIAGLVRNYQYRPEMEFYDLENDPEERLNLAEESNHRDKIAAMQTRLRAWMKEQGDDGLKTELEAPAHQVRPRPLWVTSNQEN